MSSSVLIPDTLSLHDLALSCRIGVTDEERAVPQAVHLDVWLAIDAARAAASDHLQDAVDYAALAKQLQALARSRPFVLMETLAEASAALVLAQARTRWVRVRVKKRALPGMDHAAVEITRAVSTAGRSRRTSRSPTAART